MAIITTMITHHTPSPLPERFGVPFRRICCADLFMFVNLANDGKVKYISRTHWMLRWFWWEWQVPSYGSQRLQSYLDTFVFSQSFGGRN
jgi:hypothetical protein